MALNVWQMAPLLVLATLVSIAMLGVLIWFVFGKRIRTMIQERGLVDTPSDFNRITQKEVSLYRVHKSTGFSLNLIMLVAVFSMGMSWILVDILSSKDWCQNILVANKIATKTAVDAANATADTVTSGGVSNAVDVLNGCIGLQAKIISALTVNSYILSGTVTAALLVLIIVVVANAQFKGKVSREGISGELQAADGSGAVVTTTTETKVSGDAEVSGTEEVKG